MSITVNELKNFSIENYKGIPVTYNAEDLSFIAKEGEKTTDNEYKNLDTNFRFVYIKDSSLLALDESNPIVKKISDNLQNLPCKPSARKLCVQTGIHKDRGDTGTSGSDVHGGSAGGWLSRA